MKIRQVIVNNRKARIELWVRAGDVYPVPYAKLDPRPTSRNRIRDAYVDKELGNEAVTYVLESGAEGTVHIDYALEYNQDPGYLAELLAHRLSVEARNRAKRSGLSRRELARRLHTSLPQLYRLLDPANTRKSLKQLIALLHLLDCSVEVVLKPRKAACEPGRRGGS
jgi:hypothetical protein